MRVTCKHFIQAHCPRTWELECVWYDGTMAQWSKPGTQVRVWPKVIHWSSPIFLSHWFPVILYCPIRIKATAKNILREEIFKPHCNGVGDALFYKLALHFMFMMTIHQWIPYVNRLPEDLNFLHVEMVMRDHGWKWMINKGSTRSVGQWHFVSSSVLRFQGKIMSNIISLSQDNSVTMIHLSIAWFICLKDQSLAAFRRFATDRLP